MNRAASITVSPSLLKCHHCCTGQTPLDYDQLKLSWNQFFLSPKRLRSYFRPSGLLRKKKKPHLFSSKKVQRAPNSWLSDGYILAWSLLQKTSICLWKWKCLHPTRFAVSPAAEAPEYFSTETFCCPHYNKNANPCFWLYYVRHDNRK